MTTKQLVVDPHFHYWFRRTHSWLRGEGELDIKDHCAGDLTPIATDYSIEAFWNEPNKYIIDKSVHIQCYNDDPIQETAKSQQLYEKYGQPNGIIGYAELQSNDIENILKQHMNYRNFRGIRQMLDYHPKYSNRRQSPYPELIKDKNLSNGLKIMAKYGLIFDLHIYPIQMNDAYHYICKNHPNLTIVLNHCGFPLKEEWNLWKTGMKKLSQCSNVNVKLSGFAVFFENNAKKDKKYMQDIILFVIKHFGVKRCMFASNFPVDKLYWTYDELYDTYFDILKRNNFSKDEIHDMTYLNACRIYKLQDTLSKL